MGDLCRLDDVDSDVLWGDLILRWRDGYSSCGGR